MLEANGVKSIRFVGDSFVRHAYQTTLMLLNDNFKDGGLTHCSGLEHWKCPVHCQYAGQLEEKSCRGFVSLHRPGSACGGSVRLSLRYGAVPVPTESDVREYDFVVWGLGNHGVLANIASALSAMVATLPVADHGFCREGQPAKVLAAQKVIYLDTHAQARWFTNFTNCSVRGLSGGATQQVAAEDMWMGRASPRPRPAETREERDFVTKYHNEMPVALRRVCGVARVVSVFDASVRLSLTPGTDFRNMTWDGYHWGLAVNLWKAAGILNEISTRVRQEL